MISWCPQRVESRHFISPAQSDVFARTLLTSALMLSLSSCSAGACQLPEAWVFATDIALPAAPSSTKVLFYAQETKAGQWSWYWGRRSTGSYQELLTELAPLSKFDPRPMVIFTFAEGHTCQELNELRSGIAQAARCSETGEPCVEGAPDELPF